MDSLLLRVLEELNGKGIRYALLRGYDELEKVEARKEVDLLVVPDHLVLLADTLAANGFAAIPSWGHAPHHFFLAYERENDCWLKFDVVTDLVYGKPIRSLRINLAEACLRHSRRCGPTYALSSEDEFITLLLHCLLDKANFEPGYRRRLKELQNQIANDERATARLATFIDRYLVPGLTWSTLIRAIDSQDWQSLLKRRTPVVRQLFWRNPLMAAWRQFSGRILRRIRPLLFALRCRGLAVAVLATDGAGKTTLAQGLTRDDSLRARWIYMGTNIKASNSSLPTTKWLKQKLEALEGRPLSAVRVLLRGLSFTNRLAEQWLRYGVGLYHKLLGRFVIFDRYIYDSWVAGKAATPGSRMRRWLLESGCPTPDLVVLLDAPAALLYRRKGEHSPEWLERQRLAYLGLKDRLPQMVIVDATQEADEVRREVTNMIWDHYRVRTGKK